MIVLESIQLRSEAEVIPPLCEQIKKSFCRDGGCDGVISVYRRSGLATDLAIHIRHVQAPSLEPSILGLRLAAALRAFGLVEHAVWEHMTEIPPVDHFVAYHNGIPKKGEKPEQ